MFLCIYHKCFDCLYIDSCPYIVHLLYSQLKKGYVRDKTPKVIQRPVLSDLSPILYSNRIFTFFIGGYYFYIQQLTKNDYFWVLQNIHLYI